MSMLSEMGIHVESKTRSRRRRRKGGTEVATNGKARVMWRWSRWHVRKAGPHGRPVRMYACGKGVVELLSREGEIAIAKRIEQAANTMNRGAV